MLKALVGLLLVVLCCCHQSSAEDKALKADLERTFVGKSVVSKIVLGGKAKPRGQWATYPVNTLVYPDATRVTFRVEQEAMRATVKDGEIKQQFDQGTSFQVTAVDLKDDRLELSLTSGGGDPAKLKLMLGAGWQTNFDASSIQAQLALIFSVVDQHLEQRQPVTTAQSSGSDGAFAQDAAARKKFAEADRQKMVNRAGSKIDPGFNITAEGPDATIYAFHLREKNLIYPICEKWVTSIDTVLNMQQAGFTQLVCTDDANTRFTFDLPARSQFGDKPDQQGAAARKSDAEETRERVIKQLGNKVLPGFNITAEGPDASIYVYHSSGTSYADCSNMLTKEDFISNLRSFGFTQLVCTDDGNTKFTFDLTAQQPSQPAQRQAPVAVQPPNSGTASAISQQSHQGGNAYSYPQDAAALEAQYKTCAMHYIPADKCTPEIYQQLKEKDEAPLDPLTALALRAVKYYQTRLRNPASLQIRTAYVTTKGDVCLEVGAQNGAGGMTVSNVVYLRNGSWLDEGGVFGGLAQQSGGGVNRWDTFCTKGIFHPKLVAGTDVTEKINQALKDGK